MSGIRNALALAGVALLASCGDEDSLSSGPSRPPDGILWMADGSRPIHRDWASYATADACWERGNALTAPGSRSSRARRTSRVAPPGRRWSYVFNLLDGDDCSGERAELGQGNPGKPALAGRVFREGDEAWIGYQLLVPRTATTVSTWQCLGQLKAAGRGGPVLCPSLTNGRLSIEHATSSAAGSVGLRRLWTASRAVAPRRWLRFLFHVGFSGDPREGFVEMRADLADGHGMRVRIPRTSLFTLKLDAAGAPVAVHSRIGIYRDEGATGDSRVYFAGYTVGSKRKRVEAVAFGGDSR